MNSNYSAKNWRSIWDAPGELYAKTVPLPATGSELIGWDVVPACDVSTVSLRR
jgi:hypothetical protein